MYGLYDIFTNLHGIIRKCITLFEIYLRFTREFKRLQANLDLLQLGVIATKHLGTEKKVYYFWRPILSGARLIRSFRGIGSMRFLSCFKDYVRLVVEVLFFAFCCN